MSHSSSRFGKKPLETVAEAVRALDYKNLTVDDVSALLSYLPSREEIRKLQARLGHSDQSTQRGDGNRGEASSSPGDKKAKLGSVPRAGAAGTAKRGQGAENHGTEGCSSSGSGGMAELSKAEKYLALMVEVPRAKDRLDLMHSCLTLHARIELVSSLSVHMCAGCVSLEGVVMNTSAYLPAVWHL